MWASPTTTELQNFLIAGKLISNPPTAEQALLDLSLALEAAEDAWERITGYKPFLAGTASARKFDVPGGCLLDLRGGLVSLTSLTVNGAAWTSGTHFWLRPTNAPAEGKPYTYIEFLYPPSSTTPQAIEITGPWGYATTLPLAVKRAILNQAAYSLMPQLQVQSTAGGLKRWREGDVEREYSEASIKGVQAAGEQLSALFKATARHYRLIRVN